MKKVCRLPSAAVVVPVYRDDLRPDEELSLRHLETHLGGYDRIFLAPERLRPQRPGFEVLFFENEYFASVDAYSRLLLSSAFYRSLESFEFILIYQLDGLVFSDRLAQWCRAGYDYIGAPWLTDPTRPERGFSRVGNGGLSLRRVAAFLDVLEDTPASGLFGAWHRLFHAPLPDLETWPRNRRLAKRLRVMYESSRGVSEYTRSYSLNEDRFWSDRARLFGHDFRIAPPEEALHFSFEQAPRYCLQRTGGQLPFGCHAWSRWDPSFWEPYLLR